MKDFVCISNGCTAGYFYSNIGKQYNTPFIWSRTDEIEILNAIKRWNEINWENIKVYAENDTNYPVIRVDNMLTLCYRHYRYSPADIIPRFDNTEKHKSHNVFYYDHLGYTEIKYRKRIARMPKIDPSILLMHWGNQWGCTDNMLRSIIDYCNEHNLKIAFFVFNQPEFEKYNNENCLCINLNLEKKSSLMSQIVERYSNDILKHFS